MPRRGENIYKRQDGRWEGRYIKSHEDGKTKYGYVYARSYSDVKQKLIYAKTAILSTTESAEGNELAQSSIDFQIIAEEWYETQKSQWKLSSAVKFRNILDSYLLPKFGEQSIVTITRTAVSAYSTQLLTTGGTSGVGLSPKTVSGILSVMVNIFDYAEEENGCPVANIRGIPIKQHPKPMRVLSMTEQQILSDYLCTNQNTCNLGILLCLYTGLRVGEICALKWKNIHLNEQFIFVQQTMQRLQIETECGTKTSVLISSPKSECSIRKIPIPSGILPILCENCQENEAYILTGTSQKYMEPRTMQNRFKATIKACGIDDANFHALRHTFATRCVELGFDAKSLSEILGHASVSITLNRYVHPSMELKKQNMDMLSQLLAVK